RKKLPVIRFGEKFPQGTHNGCESESQNQSETSALRRPNSELVDRLFSSPESLNKFKRKHLKNTAGKAWFDLPPQTITPEIEKDLCLLKLRSAIDLKRHYKKGDSKSKTLLKYFLASLFVISRLIAWLIHTPFCLLTIRLGMMIVSTSYFFTVRLTRKERKEGTSAAELLSDRTLADYSWVLADAFASSASRSSTYSSSSVNLPETFSQFCPFGGRN
ncbi:rrna-processing protein fcf2, partial [Quercus suber]